MDGSGHQVFWIVIGVTALAALAAVLLRVRRPARMPVPLLALMLSLPALSVTGYLVVDDLDGMRAVRTAQAPLAQALKDPADIDAYARGLRAHLERQPRDARAWVLYARMQAELDRFAEAAQAYEKALASSPKVAKDPAVWCEYADALGMTQDGRLAGKPQEFIRRALMIDPEHPKALELAGSAEYEQERYTEALGYWRPLLAKLEPGSRQHRELAAAIERTERLAAATPGAAEKRRN
jgi:cytochrome c-type biogenesis protein CcmH